MRFKYIYHVLFATSLSLSYVITPESTNGGNIDVYETSNIQQDSLGSLSSPNDQSNSIGQTSQSSDLVATGQFDGLNPVGQPDVPGDLSPPTDQPSTTGQNSQISDLLVASEFNGLNSVDQPDESGSVNQPDESSITTQAEDSDDIPYLYSGPLETIQVWDGISGGLRELSYHTTPDGSAIINGDIVWGPESDLLAQAVDSDANSPLNTRAFSIPAHSGWPNAEIKYKYDSDDGEAIMSNSINAAIAAWLNGAPYLKFTQVHPNSAEPAEAILTIYTGVCAGQSCYVGYKHKPKMQMQRDCTDRTKSWGRAALEGIIHEFGHSLGLQHEHQRPDRNQFVRYQCENVNPICSTMPRGTNCCAPVVPKGCCQFKHDFDIVRGEDYAGPYDFHSIMHYIASTCAYKGKTTLVSLVPGETVQQKLPPAPSRMDFDRVCKIYSAQCHASR